ncbi:uncharacterized protein VTP21DRAFT_7019 [Calcarisporiella thermophila]|uniref:uncharacterized protein n=1 Tax=Calcarisporiella thermophila TaxID=911321 RepID=UPI003742019B
MSVVLDPSNQLSFRRPLTTQVKEILRIKNPNPYPVAFKVKTTAPKQYCVRPNSGRVESQSELDVQILLQPLKEDPPPDFKSRDKFLVQTIPITPELEEIPSHTFWSQVEKTHKDKISDKKIRCVYLPPAGHSRAASDSGPDSQQSGGQPGAQTGAKVDPYHSAAEEDYPPSTAGHGQRAKPPHAPQAQSAQQIPLQQAQSHAQPYASTRDTGSNATSAVGATGATGEDAKRRRTSHQRQNERERAEITRLQKELNDARDMMERLQSKIENLERERKSRREAALTRGGVVQSGEMIGGLGGGVSVLMAALIAVISFLIAYWFF